MTINTHSKIEKNYCEKSRIFMEELVKIDPDVVALQEVNQSIDSQILSEDIKRFQVCQNSFSKKRDNHLLHLKKIGDELGKEYYYTYLGFKQSYRIFEEGLAIITKEKPDKVENVVLSRNNNPYNWKTRQALMVTIKDTTYVCVHMGFWEDEEEPFLYQFNNLKEAIKKKKNVYLMGDFNTPAPMGEGYRYVIENGFFDTYLLAEEKDDGITVIGKIDGWENKEDKRIDYIFSKNNVDVKKTYTLFNQKTTPVISDHFAVVTEIL